MPSVESYLGRVTKARILAAVREARGDAAAERIASSRKPEMAQAAEELLAGTGWLPSPLRTPRAGRYLVEAAPACVDGVVEAVSGGDLARAPRPTRHAIAAE